MDYKRSPDCGMVRHGMGYRVCPHCAPLNHEFDATGAGESNEPLICALCGLDIKNKIHKSKTLASRQRFGALHVR